ncbi:C40 family peptidase [Sporomusa malonica]|uniref:Cell wall-associated hydrolase, NlpC family n=1 Tax=Sporomusa malonica TaxID=112901 RepID=A0A1W1Z7J8_9FIRM|nr:C40 family peptidase [Sporomusa malonica]SMC44430.1 Cell wall-associated hydrolase, NlpC family [Sporomusa malonica]
MTRWAVIALLTSALLSGAAAAEAAPASGYNQFFQSLDAVLAGAVMPVADEQQMAVRSPSLSNGQATQILAVARNMLGQPVVWGGASPAQGFDCSGLVQYVYRQAGINLPRTADLQFLVGRTVSPAALQLGDLVYFTTYEPGASHVGIYIGGNKFIHTSFSQGIVAISDMNDAYFVKRYYGAKRVL